MKLSEAIRLVATMKPQTFTGYENNSGTRTCALGAAMDAIGKHPESWTWGEFLTVNAMKSCPVRRCKHCDENMEDMIVHLNDDHKWKRERIANWVELEEVGISMEEIAFLGKEAKETPEEIPEPIPTPEEEPVQVA